MNNGGQNTATCPTVRKIGKTNPCPFLCEFDGGQNQRLLRDFSCDWLAMKKSLILRLMRKSILFHAARFSPIRH